MSEGKFTLKEEKIGCLSGRHGRIYIGRFDTGADMGEAVDGDRSRIFSVLGSKGLILCIKLSVGESEAD